MSSTGATRPFLKAERNHLERIPYLPRWRKESTQPAAAENVGWWTLNVGDKLQLPTEVPVYYPSQQIGQQTTSEWDAPNAI